LKSAATPWAVTTARATAMSAGFMRDFLGDDGL
jgi:hypothetical protein